MILTFSVNSKELVCLSSTGLISVILYDLLICKLGIIKFNVLVFLSNLAKTLKLFSGLVVSSSLIVTINKSDEILFLSSTKTEANKAFWPIGWLVADLNKTLYWRFSLLMCKVSI